MRFEDQFYFLHDYYFLGLSKRFIFLVCGRVKYPLAWGNSLIDDEYWLFKF